MTPQQNWFEANPKKTLTSIIIIGFLIIDFSLAAALKIVGLFEPSYVTSSIREAFYRNPNTIYHHDLEKNISNYLAEWGKHDYRIDTNSLGFKDSTNRTVTLKPTAGTKRILLIGDSFTEGVGIAFDKTFAGLLKNYYMQFNVDILNAGVSSYSPIIYYRKIKYLIDTVGLKFDTVIVFIDLSDAEDEALGYRFDENENVISKGNAANLGAAESQANKNLKPKMSVKEFFTQYTYFLARLRNLSALLKAKTRSWDKGLKQRRALWTMDDNLFKEFAAKGLEISAGHMAQLKSYLDVRKIPLTIAVYPWPDQVLNQDLDSKQVIFWQNWATKNNIAFINLFPTFINNNLKTSAEETLRLKYIKGDVHWNERGHMAVFQTVKNKINIKELISKR